MSAVFPAWLLLLLSLAGGATGTNRLNSPSIHKRFPESVNPPVTPDVIFNPKPPTEDTLLFWRTFLHKQPPRKSPEPLLHHNDPPKAVVWQRRSRDRRNANTGGGGRGHGQLMRVGCVLGTCQVQNLSHRLYQLIGQSGREESSPINPHSPHSYG